MPAIVSAWSDVMDMEVILLTTLDTAVSVAGQYCQPYFGPCCFLGSRAAFPDWRKSRVSDRGICLLLTQIRMRRNARVVDFTMQVGELIEEEPVSLIVFDS